MGDSGAPTLDLYRLKKGSKLWHQDVPHSDTDGAILHLKHSRHGQNPLGSQLLRFTQPTFDESGSRFAVADQLGNIFTFNIRLNCLVKVLRMDIACTALSFGGETNTHQPNHMQILVGAADNSFTAYDLSTNQTLGSSLEHRTCVQHISTRPQQEHEAISTSADEALLWDLKTLTITRALNGARNIGIQLAIYTPSGEQILTLFKNDEIVVWDVKDLKVLMKLRPHKFRHDRAPHFKTMACSHDGTIVVAAGRSKFIHVWSLMSSTLLRTIEIPQPGTSVRKISFVWMGRSASQQMCAVLDDTGRVRLVDVNTCELKHTIGPGGTSEYIDAFAVCPNGRYMLSVLSAGSMTLYDLDKAMEQRPKLHHPRAAPKHQTQQTDYDASNSDPKAYKDAKRQQQQEQIQQTFAELRETQLESLLKGFGEYPAKYRMYIWRQLLQLPENLDVYNNLVAKGAHIMFSELHRAYPMKSRKLLRISQRNLSALAHWAPILGETSYCPHLAFPFFKFFQNTPFTSFEVVVTVILNWCQQWFEFFPNPPINILNMVENLLIHHDPELQSHLLRHRITTQVYAWPQLQTMLSDIFEGDEWLAVWDNILSNHPGYLLFVVVAYMTCNRVALLNCNNVNDFSFFVSQHNMVPAKKVVQRANKYFRSTPKKINPSFLLADFVPIPVGSYPVFNKYPAFIVDYQVNERERIRAEELDLLRQKALIIESQKRGDQLRLEEEASRRQHDLLLAAEKERRRQMKMEKQGVEMQKKELHRMKRDHMIKELKDLEQQRHSTDEYIRASMRTNLNNFDAEFMREQMEQKQKQQLDPSVPQAQMYSSGESVGDSGENNHENLSRIRLSRGALDLDRIQGRRALENEQASMMKKVRNLRYRVANGEDQNNSAM
eukprot:m.19868 g.19868  ORF g.19868 m.19868 type:complete len:889 (-) comp12648_c0_seq1:1726-4392(-)